MVTPDSLVSGKYYRFVGDSQVHSRNYQFVGSVIYVSMDYISTGSYRYTRLVYDPGRLETDYFPINTTDTYEELTEEESVMYALGEGR